MTFSHEQPAGRSVESLYDFSQEVQRIVDSYAAHADTAEPTPNAEVHAAFDELCKKYPDLADQYLHALAQEYRDANA